MIVLPFMWPSASDWKLTYKRLQFQKASIEDPDVLQDDCTKQDVVNIEETDGGQVLCDGLE